jgi:hypothetical protein
MSPSITQCPFEGNMSHQCMCIYIYMYTMFFNVQHTFKKCRIQYKHRPFVILFHYILWYYITLYYIVFKYTTSYYITLYYIIWYHTMSHVCYHHLHMICPCLQLKSPCFLFHNPRLYWNSHGWSSVSLYDCRTNPNNILLDLDILRYPPIYPMVSQ